MENNTEHKTTGKAKKIIQGIAVANALAMMLIGLSKWIVSESEPLWNVFVFSDFVIVPLLMGFVCAYFWRDLKLTGVKYGLYSLCNSVVAVVFSTLFLGEGYICLIIVFPLLLGFNIIGTVIGAAVFKRKSNTLNTSVIGLLLLTCVFNALTSPHSYENKVSDTMVINAPPSVVWKYVVAYDYNNEKDKYWLFKIGLPSPVQSTVEGYYKGANRKYVFSNGYIFDEKISVYEPCKDLTFDITHQPKDPEIMEHMDLLKGQFLLTDNGNGTTTLTGNSWYRLYVFPTWYYDLWASSVVRNVHTRVMEHIKKIAEAENLSKIVE